METDAIVADPRIIDALRKKHGDSYSFNREMETTSFFGNDVIYIEIKDKEGKKYTNYVFKNDNFIAAYDNLEMLWRSHRHQLARFYYDKDWIKTICFFFVIIMLSITECALALVKGDASSSQAITGILIAVVGYLAGNSRRSANENSD